MPKDQVKIKKSRIINDIVNILKIRYTEFILTVTSPNNIVLLMDNRIVQINKIF